MPVDRVTGDSTLKTVALFSPHISASSDYRFIYYYILLSSLSSLSLTNKHRGFVGDSKDDSKKCCHPSISFPSLGRRYVFFPTFGTSMVLFFQLMFVSLWVRTVAAQFIVHNSYFILHPLPLHPVNPSRHQPIGCLRARFTGCLPRASANPAHHELARPDQRPSVSVLCPPVSVL